MPLYVTVTPGLSVTDTTTLDSSALNQIASPTVDITGTIDGSTSLVVAAGSVTNAQLATMASQTVKGVETAGTPTDITLDATLTIASGALKVADSSLKAVKLEPVSAGTFVGAVNSTHIADGALLMGKHETVRYSTLFGNPGAAVNMSPEPIAIGAGLAFTPASEVAISTRSRTSNTATITTASSHGYSSNDYVSISGIGSGFDAGHVQIIVTGATTFTYTNYGANVSSGSAGTSYVRKVSDTSGVPANTLAITSTSPFTPRAWVNFNGVQITGATYSRSGTTITVTKTGHGLSNGYYVRFTATSGSATSGWYLVSGATSSQFNITDTVSGTTSGNCTLDCYMRAGQNISGIVRNAGGDYTITFTTAMSSATYCVNAFAATDILSSAARVCSTYDSTYMTASTFRMGVGNTNNGNLTDVSLICVTVFAN